MCESEFKLEARGNYKTTTPTVSTFIMSASTDVTLFGNHPARRLRFGIYISESPLGLLPSSLFLLRSLQGDSSFESFSARRIASFRRIFYKLWQSCPVVPALSLECLESQFRNECIVGGSKERKRRRKVSPSHLGTLEIT